MQQTLFLIPPSWFNGPLLIGWLVIGLIIMAVIASKYGFGKDLFGFLPMYGIVAAVIWFVLPSLQIEGLDPANPNGAMVVRAWRFAAMGSVCYWRCLLRSG